MRLLAAFQNTTRMAMYPRENRKEGPRRAALGRRSAAATCSRQIFFSDLIHLDDDIRVLLP
jgi:hypothetical protein